MTAPHFTGAVWQRSKDHQCFVTIPHRIRDYDRFTPGTPVILSLADDPAVRMRSTVRDAGKGRNAKIMRRGQAELADKFAEGTDVKVEVAQDEIPKGTH